MSQTTHHLDCPCTSCVNELLADIDTLKAENAKLKGSRGLAISIIFNGPPAHKSGRFIEVETDDGKSINAGEWIERADGLWALRITSLPLKEPTNE